MYRPEMLMSGLRSLSGLELLLYVGCPLAVLLFAQLQSCTMDNISCHYKFLSWNVRGLNSGARQEDLKQIVATFRPDFVCIQETKMAQISQSVVRNSLGQEFDNNFFFLPADGTRGGILLATRAAVMNLQNPSISNHTISANVTDIRNNTTWIVTGVYGPQGDLEKKMFIRELRRIKQAVLPKWLLLGDFNLIYKVQDKNNDRLDQRLMLTFRRALNHLEVKEIELIGRKFTWTNSHESPTMTRIDRAFAIAEWEESYVHPTAQSLSSSVSDHCPLLITSLAPTRPQPKFRFESLWTDMDGYQECVKEAWTKPVPANKNPFATLHIKLSRAAKALKSWSKNLMSHNKIVMAICREVIDNLEKAQESRQLTETERNLIKVLKVRLLGMAAIEKSRARQRSRIIWLKKGGHKYQIFPYHGKCQEKKELHPHPANK
jgi:exonuclease III